MFEVIHSRSAVVVLMLVTGFCALASAETSLSLTRSVSGEGVYTPGSTLDISIQLDISTTGTITAMGFEETIPTGWTFDSVISGDIPTVTPFPGISGLLEFSWFPAPSSYPLNVVYRITVPQDATGQQEITGNGLARILEEGPIVTSTISTILEEPGIAVPNVLNLSEEDASTLLLNAGFVVGSVSQEYSISIAVDRVKRTSPDIGEMAPVGSAVDLVFSQGQGALHSGDYDPDGVISLSELLRLIQFFNLDGYHCAENPDDTEDGFRPDLGSNQSCTPHHSDYAPQDWAVNLSELLRFIQFYNSDGYHQCPEAETEDGFCPGI